MSIKKEAGSRLLFLIRSVQVRNGLKQVCKALRNPAGERIDKIVQIVIHSREDMERQIGFPQILKRAFYVIDTLNAHVQVRSPMKNMNRQIKRGEHLPVGLKRPMGQEPAAGQLYAVVFLQPLVIAPLTLRNGAVSMAKSSMVSAPFPSASSAVKSEPS